MRMDCSSNTPGISDARGEGWVPGDAPLAPNTQHLFRDKIPLPILQ